MRVQSFQESWAKIEKIVETRVELGSGGYSTRDEKVKTKRIEQVLVSNSSLVSGLSEASGVRLSWVEVSQESPTISRKKRGTSAY